MENNNQTITKIEKKVWQLVLLAVVVILYLTLSLLGLQFFQFLGKSESIVFSASSYKYSIFLSTLILLFCAYMIVHQRKLLNLTRAFLSEKEAASKLSQDVKILSALFEISSTINSQQKLSSILDTVTRKMLTCFDAEHSSIMLLDKRSKMLKTLASFGKGMEFSKNALVPMGKSIAGWVVENGEPLLLNGEANPADFPGTPKKNRRISSSLCVPLKTGNKCIGVLNVNIVEKDRVFSESELQLITVFANSAAGAINNAILMEEKKQRIRFQTMLEQFHSPQVVRELVKKVENRKQPGKMRKKLEMTVLFADIRGFTSIMNHVQLEGIMGFLDEFYSAMTEIVFNNEGSIDKFIGDEVMAFFGAPLSLENSSENGAKAALEMVESFKELREKFSKISPHFGNLGIGVGVNTGMVFVGNVGSRRRYDHTVIGNAVNLGRRLCSHAKPGEILLAAKAVMRLNGNISSEFVDKVCFKGIPAPVDVYRICVKESL